MIFNVSSAILAFFFVIFAASAQPRLQEPEKTQQAQTCVRVVLGQVDVCCFKHGIGSFSVTERVEKVQERLLQIAKNQTFDSRLIAVIENEGAIDVMAGDTVLSSLKDGDTTEIDEHGLKPGAEIIAERMRSAVEKERKLRSPQTLTLGLIYTIATTLALIILLLVFKWGFFRIYKKIQSIDGKYVTSVKLKSFELLNSTRITHFLIWLVSAIRVLLTFLALYVYIPLVLGFFPWTANWAPKLFGYILDPLWTVGHVILNYTPNLFFIIVISFATRYLLKLVRFFFVGLKNGTIQMDGFYREWAEPTYKLTRVLILAFALVMAFPYLPGSSSPAFQGVSVFLGILLSLGSSSAIANIVAGVVLTYMRPFKIGDRVKIADTMGDVKERNLLVTRILSIKNVEITIPNSLVLGSHIVNYSATAVEDGLILNSTVTIGYDVPWKTVHELLISAATKTEGIMKGRQPFVLQTALNDFYVSYEINAYTVSPNKMALIYSDLHQNIQDNFSQAGVEIMSPHYSALRDGNESTVPSKKSNGEGSESVTNPA